MTDLAELVIESYWPQVRPYGDDLPEHWYRLRQATSERPQQPGSTDRQARIPRAVHRLRHAASGQGWTSPAQVRLGDPDAWQQTVGAVAEALAKQPIPRLQRPGTWTAAATYTPFLYDDTDFGEHVTATQALTMGVTLRPGVAAALVRAAPLLRPAVEGAWTSMVADLNQLSRVEQALHGFLFGATRTNLEPVRTALLDLGVRDCFWCGARLRTDVHVDHVLPWAHFPNDALFNLVLADQGCNLDKRDVLVGPALLDRWVDRPLDVPAAGIGGPALARGPPAVPAHRRRRLRLAPRRRAVVGRNPIVSCRRPRTTAPGPWRHSTARPDGPWQLCRRYRRMHRTYREGRATVTMSEIAELAERLRQFAAERDWEQFHTPKNLAMALAGEAGELLAELQWLTPEQSATVMADAAAAARWRPSWPTC